MGVFRNFPYSNFHEMNMDEMIKIIKNMLEEWAQYHAEWDAWKTQLETAWSTYQNDMNAQWTAYQNVMNEAWQSMQNFISNYFDNLDVQEEINNKITSMVNSGEFSAIVEPYIPPHVSAWLSEHITEPVGVVIDDSLSVAGACADAKATGDKFINLRRDINKIAEEEEVVLHKADLEETYDATYVNVGYISADGTFMPNDGYRTYYIQANDYFDAYVTPTEDDSYLSLAIYNTSVSIPNFVARYRSNDGNLPTSSNRLAISRGQWIAITISYVTIRDYDFNFYTGTMQSSDIPTDAFAENMAIKIEGDRTVVGKVTKTTTTLVIYFNKLKYEVNKYSDSAIRADLWRTNACQVLDENGVYQTVWQDSDSDGVVKISGESDFIGGYHGDETETLFKLFVDGVEYEETDTFTDLPFHEIILYFESDVYHCNTSATPDDIAFKRNKTLKFNNEGYTTENYWIAQENLTCEISYIGMLSVEDALINGYNSNENFKYKAMGDPTTKSADITDVCFVTPYGDIGIKVSEQIPIEHYGCAVTHYSAQNRMKVYASNFTSSSHGVLSIGDVLKGKATTYFRG